MNKDLDARLLPSGEYRDAINISVSQSEGGDVGAVENVKGNELKASIEPSVANLGVIGYLMDEQKNYIYIFSTDQDAGLTTTVPIDANCFIHRYDANTSVNPLTKLVEGSFLNFSKQSFISGVNLLEDLLFFTDNRNQPRVINVESASLARKNNSFYYTREENIAVAKLAPLKTISILSLNEENVSSVDVVLSEFTISNPLLATIYKGDFVSKDPNKIGIVVDFNSTTGVVTVDNAIFTLTAGDVVVFSRSSMINRTQEYLDDYNGNPDPTASNPNYDSEWDGDPDFITDKFIRFAYRYKFSNNEYSIISPFTATMFIPKQFGYFVGQDEERTYKSSIVAFMENFAQEMVLNIPFPSQNPADDYKISEVDIIYKESDGLTLKVLSTLQVNSILPSQLNGDDNYFSFSYESKKPYKTLPEDDLVRVYDRVPIKAKAQEVVGNRVVYANYTDKNNFPNSIDYYVRAQQKDYGRYDNTAQYPYHSLKQSRTYQLGFVLSDKYGRSSSVILSSKDVNGGALGRGSTYFHRYSNSSVNNPLFHPYGDALRVTVENLIPERKEGTYPGAYADSTGKIWTLTPGQGYTITGNTYTINQNLTSKLSIGDSLEGKYIDYTKIISITYNGAITTIVTSSQIADYYKNPNEETLSVYGYIINPLGWYSYKVVVKQTEQEYYNVYLPGIINGTFDSGIDVNQVAQIVLINDNINKIPRDLSEVGPQQKKFRSSVRLYGRVTPAPVGNASFNTQWYPSKTSDNVSEIAEATDFGYDVTVMPDMYDALSNPLIAKIATITTLVGGNQISIGSLYTNAPNTEFQLGVYETTPVETRLELFYETGTNGLISVLNKDTSNTSDTGATGVIDYTWFLSESSVASPSNPFDCTTDFRFIDGAGTIISPGDITGIPTIINVTNQNGQDITSGTPFAVVQGTNGSGFFKIQTSSTFTYVNGSNTANDYNFTMRVTTLSGTTTNVLAEGNLTNETPSFDFPDPIINVELGATSVVDFSSPSIVSNGSSILASSSVGLVYSIVSQKLNNVNVSNFTISSTGLLQIVSQSGVAVGNDYEVVVRVSDASGLDVNFLTAVNTLSVRIGANPLNYNIPTNPGYKTNFGPGCEYLYSETGDTQTFAVAFVFGSTTNVQNITGLIGVATDSPPNNPLIVVQSETTSFTDGTIRLKLASGYQCGGGALWQARLKVYVSYRANSSSSWSMAQADGSNSAWLAFGEYITINSSTAANGVVIGDFSIKGEYRVIINPEQGTLTNSPCGVDSSCATGFMTEFRYCDAVINNC